MCALSFLLLQLLVRKDVYKSGIFSNWSAMYESSTISNWMNNTYKQLLSTNIQNFIGSTKFYYTDGISTDGSSSNLGILERSIFALSYVELGGEEGYYNEEGSMLPTANLIHSIMSDNQWTRSPCGDSTKAWEAYSNDSGFNTWDVDRNSGYCPCFTLPSSLKVTSSLNVIV